MQDVKQPVRVLHVLGALNRGGAETMVMNLYRHVDRDQVQFDFMIHTEEKCDYEDEILALGGRIHHICRFRGTNTAAYVRAWKRFFKEHREYRIVHGHMRSTASIYLSVAKRYGVFTISHSHSTSSGKGISAAVKNMMQLPIRYVAEYFFACSKTAGEWLFGKKVIAGDRFAILKNAIDVDQYRFDPGVRERVRRELGIGDQLVIGHVGRFDPSKNHRFLISVFEQIHSEIADCRLVLAGDGELRDEIETLAKQKGLEKEILFLGTVSNVEKILQGMDIFVFPSYYEGLGIVAIEAQASGLLTVCSDSVPGEVNVTGLAKFLPLGDCSYWKDKILQFWKQKEASRIGVTEQVKQNGYDIHETSGYMQRFYLNAYEDISRGFIAKAKD